MINVEDYIGIAVSLANKFYKIPMFNINYTLDEIVSEAKLHLVRASKDFDETKGVKFTTFSTKYITNGCYNFVRDNPFFPHKKGDMKTCGGAFESIDCKFSDCDNKETEVDFYGIIPTFDDFSSMDLVNFIDSFKFEDKAIITLFLEGYSQREIANTFNCSNERINKRMYVIRNRIKEGLSI